MVGATKRVPVSVVNSSYSLPLTFCIEELLLCAGSIIGCGKVEAVFFVLGFGIWYLNNLRFAIVGLVY